MRSVQPTLTIFPFCPDSLVLKPVSSYSATFLSAYPLHSDITTPEQSPSSH